MNRRQAISSLATLTFAPFLGAFDHSRNTTSSRILVACTGESGKLVFDDLIQCNTSDLLQPIMIDSEAEIESVIKSISEQRVVFVAELDAEFDGPPTWKMLRLAREQTNCCHNFFAYIIYPYLRFEELRAPLIPDKIPRWAYSTVDYVSVVRGGSLDKNNVQSRWQLRYFNTDITKVERRVADQIMKVQLQGNWR